MRGGPLRHLVTVQRTTDTRTTAGGFEPGWAVLGKVWAQVSPVRGREYVNAQAGQADVTHKIVMRHDPRFTIAPKDRVLHGTRVFAVIHAINVEERDRMLEVMAKEEV